MPDSLEEKWEKANVAFDDHRNDEALILFKEVLAEADDDEGKLMVASIIRSMIIVRLLDLWAPKVGTTEYADCHMCLKTMLECYDRVEPELQKNFREHLRVNSVCEGTDIEMLRRYLQQMEHNQPVGDPVSIRVTEPPTGRGLLHLVFGDSSWLDMQLAIYLDDELVETGSMVDGVAVNATTTTGKHNLRWRCARNSDHLLGRRRPDEYDKNVEIYLEKSGSYEYSLGLSRSGLSKSQPELRFLE